MKLHPSYVHRLAIQEWKRDLQAGRAVLVRDPPAWEAKAVKVVLLIFAVGVLDVVRRAVSVGPRTRQTVRA